MEVVENMRPTHKAISISTSICELIYNVSFYVK